MENTMKKLMFIFLLVIPFCKAANPDQSWHNAVQHIPNWQQQVELSLNNSQIVAIPDNFNPPNLEWLYLDNNQIVAIPDNFNPPHLQILDLINNQIVAIPDNFNSPNLQRLYLDNNNIQEINPKRLLEQFPHLVYLNLSNNPLHPADIRRLRELAQEAGRNIDIIAENILPEGYGIKRA